MKIQRLYVMNVERWFQQTIDSSKTYQNHQKKISSEEIVYNVAEKGIITTTNNMTVETKKTTSNNKIEQ